MQYTTPLLFCGSIRGWTYGEDGPDRGLGTRGHSHWWFLYPGSVMPLSQFLCCKESSLSLSLPVLAQSWALGVIPGEVCQVTVLLETFPVMSQLSHCCCFTAPNAFGWLVEEYGWNHVGWADICACNAKPSGLALLVVRQILQNAAVFYHLFQCLRLPYACYHQWLYKQLLTYVCTWKKVEPMLRFFMNRKKSREKKFLNFSMITETFQMETNYIP